MTSLLKVSNVLGYGGLITVNVLSNNGAFGPTNAELSAKYPTPITPAGWAFAIWGLIFLLQGLGVACQFVSLGQQNGVRDMLIQAIGWRWQLGWLLECLWQLMFVRQSKQGMWLCLGCLGGALCAFASSLVSIRAALAASNAQPSTLLRAAYVWPCSINTAWLSVATCLGALIVMHVYGYSFEHKQAAAIVLALLASGVGAWNVVTQGDVAYGWSLVWAFTAVARNGHSSVITILSSVVVALLGGLTLYAHFSIRSAVQPHAGRQAVKEQLLGDDL